MTWCRSAVVRSVQRRQRLAELRLQSVRPHVEEAKANGWDSLRQIAAFLNEKGIRTSRGSRWSAAEVRRVLIRLGYC